MYAHHNSRASNSIGTSELVPGTYAYLLMRNKNVSFTLPRRIQKLGRQDSRNMGVRLKSPIFWGILTGRSQGLFAATRKAICPGNEVAKHTKNKTAKITCFNRFVAIKIAVILKSFQQHSFWIKRGFKLQSAAQVRTISSAC